MQQLQPTPSPRTYDFPTSSTALTTTEKAAPTKGALTRLHELVGTLWASAWLTDETPGNTGRELLAKEDTPSPSPSPSLPPGIDPAWLAAEKRQIEADMTAVMNKRLAEEEAKIKAILAQQQAGLTANTDLTIGANAIPVNVPINKGFSVEVGQINFGGFTPLLAAGIFGMGFLTGAATVCCTVITAERRTKRAEARRRSDSGGPVPYAALQDPPKEMTTLHRRTGSKLPPDGQLLSQV